MMEFLKSNPKWTRKPKEVKIDGQKVIVTTEKGTDLWARTYYGFQNDNAPVFQIETKEIYQASRCNACDYTYCFRKRELYFK